MMRRVQAAICGLGVLLLVACQGDITPSPSPTADAFPARLAEGDAYAAAGDRTAAVATYRTAAETRPADPTPHLHLTQLYLDWNRVDDGLAALETAETLDAPAVEVAQLRTALHARAGNWEEVTLYGAAALELDPGDVATWHRVARAAVAQGDVSRAMVAYQTILEIDPDDALAQERVGVLQALSDPSGALPHLETAGTPLATNVAAALLDAADWPPGRHLTLVGQICVRHQEWHLAQVVLAEALAHPPIQPEAEALLGRAWDEVGRPELARPHLEAAVELAPGSSLAQSLLGLHLLEQGEPGTARPHLETAYDLDPLNPAFSLYLAHLYGDLGRYDAAFIWLDEAARLAPEDVGILEGVARFYLNHGLTTEERSLEAAEALVAAAPDSPTAHEVLGRVHHRRGELEEAEEHLLRAVVLGPEEAAFYYHLGQLYLDQDRPITARRALVRAYDLVTDPALRGQIEEALDEYRLGGP